MYIFGRMSCIYTRNAVNLCKRYNIPFSFVDIDKLTKREISTLEYKKGGKLTTLPVIFKKKNYSAYIGGYSDLEKNITKYKSNHIIFNIKENKFICKDSIIISNYLLTPTLQDLLTIPDISNGEFNYILCPGYIHEDYQIGVTGTSKTDETIQNTLLREVNEEVGMKLNKNVKYDTFLDSKKKRKIAHGVYHIQEFNPEKNNITNIVEKSKDDKTRKISALLYGNMINLKRMILETSAKGGLNLCINDNIIYIGILSVKFLKNNLPM